MRSVLTIVLHIGAWSCSILQHGHAADCCMGSASRRSERSDTMDHSGGMVMLDLAA
jgi:hypothetical protein